MWVSREVRLPEWQEHEHRKVRRTTSPLGRSLRSRRLRAAKSRRETVNTHPDFAFFAPSRASGDRIIRRLFVLRERISTKPVSRNRILCPGIGEELIIGRIGGIPEDALDGLGYVTAEKTDVRSFRHRRPRRLPAHGQAVSEHRASPGRRERRGGARGIPRVR